MTKFLTHYREPGSVALACLAAVLMSCDAPVCGEGILLLNVRDVQSPEGGQQEPVTCEGHIQWRSALKSQNENLEIPGKNNMYQDEHSGTNRLYLLQKPYCVQNQQLPPTVVATCVIMWFHVTWHPFKAWRTHDGH